MKRNDLSVRQKTTKGQKLPDDWEENMGKVKSFLDFVETEKNSQEI